MNRRHVLRLTTLALASRGVACWGQEAAGGDVPWLAEIQRPPSEASADQESLRPLIPGTDAAGISVADWQRRRRELASWWREFLGEIPKPKLAPQLEVVESTTVGGVKRELVRYESEAGWPTEAYLLKPVAHDGPLPGVVVFHSTVQHSIRQPAGVEGKPEKAFGLQLTEQGCVAFCPRNFLWPDNHHIDTELQMKRFRRRHPRAKGMAKMLSDAMLAVDLLASLPEVDAGRIGAVGHSLGAKEVLYLAAFDPRVKVTVSSEGGVGTRFSNWDASWYLGPEINQSTFRREHHELLAMVAPRPFLLIGGDSADGDRSWPFVEAALPIYRLFERPPRLGLFNHRQGHSVPPIARRRIQEWLHTYL